MKTEQDIKTKIDLLDSEISKRDPKCLTTQELIEVIKAEVMLNTLLWVLGADDHVE